MEIEYVIGDVTTPHSSGAALIVHICNDRGYWGAGFVLALGRRWPQAQAQYRAWHEGQLDLPFTLGQVQFVLVAPDLWVANLIGQHGVRPTGDGPPLRYEAVREGLERVAAFAQLHSASVHMPRIGTGLAGGTWAAIAPILQTELANRGISVTVYDLA